MRLSLVLGKLFYPCLFVADIKDAFLSMQQRELVEVIVPSLVRNLAHGEQSLADSRTLATTQMFARAEMQL